MPRRPVSVLVTVCTRDGQALILRRQQPFDFWQSVTGSLQPGETHAEAARRELFEETGLRDQGTLEYTGVSRQFLIDARWRHKFVPGAAENVEFEWRFTVDSPVAITLNPEEHSEAEWVSLSDAASRVWSWTNQAALLSIAARRRSR